MANRVDAKLLRQTKFPPEFNKKVDMKKVNVEVMKKSVGLNQFVGLREPDIKSLQIQLTGFLDKETPKFCKKLWELCLSAQENPQGVPKELLEAKKLELRQEK
ncbi:Serine/arginine repetitive matrix protein 1, partial [Ascosphaera aggregata]